MWRSAGVFLGALMLSAAAQADNTPQAWLERLQQAQQQQPYQGVFVYERQNSFATFRIWQGVDQGHVLRRIQDQDGEPHERLQRDGVLLCSSRGQWLSAAGPLLTLDLDRLAQGYELRLVGRSRVAGRLATVLALIPRDRYRYAHEWHLDAQTGLLLKAVMVDADGGLLERFQFSQLSALPPKVEQLQPQVSCQPPQLAPSQPVVQSWEPQWLPPGFAQLSQQQLPGRGEVLVLSSLFSDGLNSFSVYVEPMGDQLAADARSQLGPTVAVAHRLQAEQGDVMITVVGEVPRVTAERVVLSMRPVAEAAP